jgi:RNA polymerase sigma-70 factor (ECF subfamily)
LPEAELMTRVGAGDPEAFIALVCRKYSHVESACRQVLGPTRPTEDVALEAFVQLWRQRDRIRDAEAVDGWLTRTARNLARKLTRNEARGRVANELWWQRTGESAGIANPPDRAAIQAEMVRRVRLAVSKQSDADQRVLWLAENAINDAEAAETLGLSVATFRVRLHRARQRLRVLLKKYGVTPVVGAVAFVGARTNLAASAVGLQWATGLGKLKVIVLATILAVGLAGVVWWTVATSKTDASPQPDPPNNPQTIAPVAEPSEETLTDKNLRLLRTVVAPKVCEALQPLALAGGTFKVIETDTYDSRARCVVEVNNEKSITGLGKVSRVAVYYDSYLRHSYVYFDAMGDGKWKWIDVKRPLVLFRIDELNWEMVVKLNRLEQAVQAFEELPKDPRGAAEAERRFIAMRERGKLCEGNWYRNGDPSAEARVELDNNLEMRFFRPGDKRAFLVVADAWRRELGSRAKLPYNEDGYLAAYGIYLSADGQTLTFEANERPWYRSPKTK